MILCKKIRYEVDKSTVALATSQCLGPARWKQVSNRAKRRTIKKYNTCRQRERSVRARSWRFARTKFPLMHAASTWFVCDTVPSGATAIFQWSSRSNPYFWRSRELFQFAFPKVEKNFLRWPRGSQIALWTRPATNKSKH